VRAGRKRSVGIKEVAAQDKTGAADRDVNGADRLLRVGTDRYASLYRLLEHGKRFLGSPLCFVELGHGRQSIDGWRSAMGNRSTASSYNSSARASPSSP
jgi:hypothetical protein